MTSITVYKPLALRLAEFQDRLGDLDVSHQSELALLLLRQQDLINKASEEDSPDRWRRLHESLQKYIKYRDAYEEDQWDTHRKKRDEAWEAMCDIIAGGYVYDYLVWQELRSVAEQIRKTKDSELSRRAKAAEVITEAQASMFVGYVVKVIMDNVSDRDEREKCLEELRRINLQV